MRGAKYKVRVLKHDHRNNLVSVWYENLSYPEAVEKFRFYVDCILEFNLDVRCVNIFLGKRCLKLFQNH